MASNRLHDADDPLVRKFLEDPLNKVICPKRASIYCRVSDCANVKQVTQGYDEEVGKPCPHLVGFLDMDRGGDAPVDIRPFCNHPYPLRIHKIG